MLNKFYSRKPKYIDKKTNIPVFKNQDEDVNEFSILNAAEIHDNALKWLFATHDVNEDELRKSMINKLDLKKGDNVLMTATGAGNDIKYIMEKIGTSGTLYAQDFAKEMLFAAFERSKTELDFKKYNIEFSVSDATDLPFNNNCFDATFHFGGINLYNDIKKGIDEMHRVTKNKSKIVFGDEGLACWLKKTELGKALITNNKLYDSEPPLNLLPRSSSKVNLSWVINNCFYLIEYNKDENEWNANIDIKHVGKRGGSIRTRHYGILEGIDPKLKEDFYKKILNERKSRVDTIEDLIQTYLKKN
jgi:SAM-dependent methyltransferase